MALAGDVAEVGERAGVGGGAASSDGSGATSGTAPCGRAVSRAASGLPDVDLSVRLGELAPATPVMPAPGVPARSWPSRSRRIGSAVWRLGVPTGADPSAGSSAGSRSTGSPT